MTVAFTARATPADLQRMKVRQTQFTDNELRNLATALKWADAWAGKDLEFLFDEVYADATEAVDALTESRVTGPKGQKEALKRFERVGEPNPDDRRITFTSAQASEDTVILEALVEILPRDRRSVAFLICSYLTFDPASGRIVVDHTYNLPPADPTRLQKAVEEAARS